MEFPPLYRLSDFEALSDDFLHFISDPEDDEVPGMSFNEARLYVAAERAKSVTAEFSRFLAHLKAQPSLRELIEMLGIEMG